MAWFSTSIPLIAAIMFRSNLAPRADEFGYLRELGFDIRPSGGKTGHLWSLELKHHAWGKATLFCPSEQESIPSLVTRYDPRLTDEEKATLRHAESRVMLAMEAQAGHALRDRKMMLRVGNAIMGNDGVAVFDALAMLPWTSAALQDELSHDADLDVENIYVFHAITDPGTNDKAPRANTPSYWVHTHGLQEIGKFDFDLLNPSNDALSTRTDFMRAMAFAILEDKIALDGEGIDLLARHSPLRVVSSKRFLSKGQGNGVDRYRKTVDAGHIENRGVVCDVEKPNFFAKVFRRSNMRPARVLQEAFPDAGLIRFSQTASDLMADRARKTLNILSQWREEFAVFDPTCIVKLGLPTSRGGREYPWFKVHSVQGGQVDATCLNEPVDIPNLAKDDRGTYSFDTIYDWQVLLPFTTLTPRAMANTRKVRTVLPELLKAWNQAKSAM